MEPADGYAGLKVAGPIASGLVIRLDAAHPALGGRPQDPTVSNSQRESAKKQPASDAAIAAIDRPVPAGVNAAGFGSDVVGRRAARARHPLHRAQSGRQLSRPARQPRQLPRQRAAADAALPARGKRGRHRARLRQGHRQGDGGGGAFQCRADARDHGDLQRLVRPHADGRARRHRAGRRRQAAAVDRLDPHRARPGRAGARLHQMGRPAGLAGRRARSRCCAPAGSPTPRRAGRPTSISTPGMQEAKLAEPCRRSTPALHAGGRQRARPREPSRQAADAAARRQASGDPRRPRVARSRRLERARRAGRAAERARRHRPEGRRRLSDRSSAACRRAGGTSLAPEAADAIRAADVILSLDWVDLAGTLQAGRRHVTAKVVQVSVDHHLHNGWSMDYQGLPPVDVFHRLRARRRGAGAARRARPGRAARGRAGSAASFPSSAGGKLTVDHLADALRRAVGDRARQRSPMCSLSWNGASWPFRHPLDYLGSDGGGGVGGGPGISVGAALALKGSRPAGRSRSAATAIS